MKIKNSIISKLLVIVTLVATLNMSACGYFMYPERVGQTDGRVDPAVFVLDALGLFIGLIPGVVAFAVDFTTGAIYLSPGEKSVIDKHKNRISLNELQQNGVPESFRRIEGFNVPGDAHQLADQLSVLLSTTVRAEDIQFYQPTKHQALTLLDSGHRLHY